MDTQLQTKFKFYQVTLIFSILFSLIGFSYNVWRMEVSEQNNTVRMASFEVLQSLSTLEQLIYTAHYDGDFKAGSPRKAWVLVGLINDLSVLTSVNVEQKAVTLHDVWSSNWDTIGSSDEAVERIVSAIESMRTEIKQQLKTLN